MVKTGFRTRGSVLVVSLLVAGVASYALGTSLWMGLAVATVVAGILMSDERFLQWRKRRGDRVRTRLAFEDGRRCKGCHGDLWGLDVKPAGRGQFTVKCPECGANNQFKPGKLKRTNPKVVKGRPEFEDTRSFKIR